MEPIDPYGDPDEPFREHPNGDVPTPRGRLAGLPKLDPNDADVNTAPILIEPAPLRRESTFTPTVYPAGSMSEKASRVRKITAEVEDQIVQMLESGGSANLACRALDLDRTTVEKHRAKNPEFDERCKHARALVDDAVEAALFKVCLGKVKTEGKGQVTAIVFWLKNRRPNEWRDTHDLTLRPGDGNESQFILPGGQVLPAASSGLSVARIDK